MPNKNNNNPTTPTLSRSNSFGGKKGLFPKQIKNWFHSPPRSPNQPETTPSPEPSSLVASKKTPPAQIQLWKNVLDRIKAIETEHNKNIKQLFKPSEKENTLSSEWVHLHHELTYLLRIFNPCFLENYSGEAKVTVTKLLHYMPSIFVQMNQLATATHPTRHTKASLPITTGLLSSGLIELEITQSDKHQENHSTNLFRASPTKTKKRFTFYRFTLPKKTFNTIHVKLEPLARKHGYDYRENQFQQSNQADTHTSPLLQQIFRGLITASGTSAEREPHITDGFPNHGRTP